MELALLLDAAEPIAGNVDGGRLLGRLDLDLLRRPENTAVE